MVVLEDKVTDIRGCPCFSPTGAIGVKSSKLPPRSCVSARQRCVAGSRTLASGPVSVIEIAIPLRGASLYTTLYL